MDIRNIAIIAHVDHGKTTLIDGLFKQAGVFSERKEAPDRVMDSGELEKERGITITAKNASFIWKNTKINIVDTPGHSDFGGEVERALFMVDGALLVVDASEGPLAQTRFVLSKALKKNIKIIVVINKVDRADSRIDEVEEEILELFYDLAKSDEQAHYKTLYASARNGWANFSLTDKRLDFTDLLDTIIKEIPAPLVNHDAAFQMLVTNINYNSFVGQIAVGRIEAGTVKAMSNLVIIGEDGKSRDFTVTSLETLSGLETIRVDELSAGNIALIAGVEAPTIGDTITTKEHNKALPRINVDQPLVGARISINTSPLAGTEGQYVTSRKLEDLLKKACLANVSLKLEQTKTPECFLLKARGELQIIILVEQLRRQGFEIMVGRPEVIPIKGENGELLEPLETMNVDVPSDKIGTITEILSARGGKLEFMELMEGSSRVRLDFTVPTRGLIGIRSKILTETSGEAIYSSSFMGKYIPYQGIRFSRANGAMISDRAGVSVQYGLFHLQERGRLFINDGVKVYEGMIFGEYNRPFNLPANPTKPKKLSNVRSVQHDEATRLDPVVEMSLDAALEWVDDDEWVEVTPKSIRLRKAELNTKKLEIVRGSKKKQ